MNLADGAVTYLIRDALGSVRGAVDSNEAIVGTASYDAWGNPETPGGLTSITPFGFAGGITDPSGLIYLINRYYDPATGQFISVDPAVAQTGQPYAYAGDDPVNAIDPTGLATLGLCGGISLAVSILYYSAQGCLTRTLDRGVEPASTFGVTGTVCASQDEGSRNCGGLGLSLGAAATIQVTNATNLNQLKAWFVFISVGAGFITNFTTTLFWGSDNPHIFGFEGGLGYGIKNGTNVDGGASYTWVHNFNGAWIWAASSQFFKALGHWATMDSVSGLNSRLSRAHSVLRTIESHPCTGPFASARFCQGP